MPAMSLTELQWRLIALLAIFNLVSARVPPSSEVPMKSGRSLWVVSARPALRWLVITLCFTAIPYLAYALYHNFAWLLSGKGKTPPCPPPPVPATGRPRRRKRTHERDHSGRRR